ncbi:hypothetical protein [Litorimonas sp. WD9-15]|uniref:hypothetical protein n=1 Tax=Litorimonas sp. WD9-15 TaxID=3418716 RepID=UPI003D085072
MTEIHPSSLPVPDKSMLSMFGDINSIKAGRCWAPLDMCENTPIAAHSIQNSRVLDVIHEEGRVYQINSKVGDQALKTEFRLIGRNKVTTFRGLCGNHDREIFAPIDSGDLVMDTDQQKDLLMWRAITSEMSAKMAMALYFQKQFQERIDQGKASPNSMDPFGMESMQWMMVLHDFYKYREKFWSPLIVDTDKNLNRGDIFNKRHILKDTGAKLAASSFFVVRGNGSDSAGHLGVNIWPVGNDTYVQISYVREDIPVAPKLIREYLYKKKFTTRSVSSLLLNYVQNFVLKPSVVDNWPDEKRKALINVFSENVLGNPVSNLTDTYDLFA